MPLSAPREPPSSPKQRVRWPPPLADAQAPRRRRQKKRTSAVRQREQELGEEHLRELMEISDALERKWAADDPDLDDDINEPVDLHADVYDGDEYGGWGP